MEVHLFASPYNYKLEKYYTRGSYPPRLWDRCTDGPVEVSQLLRFSSSPAHTHYVWKTQSNRSEGSNSNPVLAEQAMVPLTGAAQLPRPSTPASQAGPSVAGLNSRSVPGTSPTEGLVLRRERLVDLSCSSGVVFTLISARTTSTNRVYGMIWSKFAKYMSASDGSCSNPKIQDILGSLQTGLDLALLAPFRVQKNQPSPVSWARHPLVRQFFKRAVRLRPQRKRRFPKWDLPLVLDFLSDTGLECPEPLLHGLCRPSNKLTWLRAWLLWRW